MSINSISANYLELTNNNGTIGNQGGVTVSYEDDILTFTEADGDVYQMNAANLSQSDIDSLSLSLNATVASNETAQTTNTSKADEEGDLDSNKAKMEEYQGQWDNLKTTADSIKEVVEQLSDDIKANLDEAIKEQQEITEDEQNRISEFVSNQITQFKKDKENGKDVKLTDLQSTIQQGMSDSGFDDAMSALMSNLVVTNAKMVQMDGLLTELGSLNSQMKELDAQMVTLADTIEKQEAEAAKCCDPIGFENSDGTKFEFVLDKDGNGELSNFSEFLGSENFFDEMAALDTDGSRSVTTDEMNDAGLKVLVTETNGTQSLKSIADAFGGKDVSVNLDSYKEAAEGSKASNGQTLLGNFDISVGDEIFNGYSTLDSADYLNSNYNFTDANPNNLTTGNAATAELGEAVDSERSEYTEGLDAFIEDYSLKLADFEKQYDSIVNLMGLDEELINSIKEFAAETGAAAVEGTIKEVEAKQQAEVEAEEKEEEEKEQEEAIAA